MPRMDSDFGTTIWQCDAVQYPVGPRATHVRTDRPARHLLGADGGGRPALDQATKHNNEVLIHP